MKKTFKKVFSMIMVLLGLGFLTSIVNRDPDINPSAQINDIAKNQKISSHPIISSQEFIVKTYSISSGVTISSKEDHADKVLLSSGSAAALLTTALKQGTEIIIKA